MIQKENFWTSPQSDYKSRRKEFLEFSADSGDFSHTGRRAGPPTARGLFSQISRLELRKSIDEGIIRDSLDRVDKRLDCSDFAVAAMLRILYLYRGNGLLSDKIANEIQRSLIGFKYWMYEPGENTMCFISENHQIMFHSDEYLAGQMFPDEIFSNGQDGRWHYQKGRERILRWIDLRARTGFGEWDSNVYYDEDMAPLLNLIDFSEEEGISRRAAMILDVMFFDMAVDSFRGTYGTSHGRTYLRSILGGRKEATSGVQKIAWGLGSFNNPDNRTSVCLATSRHYRVPETIEAIGQDMPEEFSNKEHQGILPEEFYLHGIRFDNPDTAPSAWMFAKMASGQNAVSLLEVTDRHRSKWFDEVIRPIVSKIRDAYKELERRGIPDRGELDFLSLPAVNKIAYRTPDYQLSTAQDYRKGEPAWHQHIWQATLGPDAVVFTFHRSDEDEIPSRFWAGRFPRAAQFKNLLVSIYKIPEFSVLGAGFSPITEKVLVPRTLAYFPRFAFDEILEQNGWVFARKGQGFLALRSQVKTEWTSSVTLQREGLIAEGRENVWVCQMGRKSVDGDFENWVEKIVSAEISFGDLSVRYMAPGVGEVKFGWEGPLEVDGREISLRGYSRFDNLYCKIQHGSDRYKISIGEKRLVLDFCNGTRNEFFSEGVRPESLKS